MAPVLASPAAAVSEALALIAEASVESTLDDARLQPPDDTFAMLGKTFRGLTDELLLSQTEAVEAIAESDRVVRVRPELVVEIALGRRAASTRHPRWRPVRFRVLRYRPDGRRRTSTDREGGGDAPLTTWDG